MLKDSWYHLECQKTRDGIITACSCPRSLTGLCIHRRYFQDYEVERLIQPPDDATFEEPEAATLFLRQIIPTLGLQSLISVQSMSTSLLKGRAIVTHILSLKGGVWSCSKDPGSDSCYHIGKAKVCCPEPTGDRLVTMLDGLGEEATESGVDISDIGASEAYCHCREIVRLTKSQRTVRDIPSRISPSIPLSGRKSIPTFSSTLILLPCAFHPTNPSVWTRPRHAACALLAVNTTQLSLLKFARLGCTPSRPYIPCHSRCNLVLVAPPFGGNLLVLIFEALECSTTTTLYLYRTTFSTNTQARSRLRRLLSPRGCCNFPGGTTAWTPPLCQKRRFDLCGLRMLRCRILLAI